MSRNPARPILVLAASALCLAVAGPAAAWPFGGPAKPAAAPAQTSGKPDPNAPKKASPQERAASARLDPLSRSAFWQRELTLDPADAEAAVGLSAALRSMGKYDEAADTVDRMMVIAPRNEEVLLESARAHIGAGHGFYAIQPLKDAEALAPKDWRPVSLMGVALEQTQRPDEAMVAYNQALKLSPDNPAVLSNLALFQATRGDAAGAEALLRRAAAQPTSTAQERQNLALVLGLEGKTAEAEHLMRQDLPPEVADANLAYFKGAGAPAVVTPAASAAPPVKPQAQPARTWGSVQGADAKGG
jgi:Flp pilus assembly protein TadD